MVSNRQICCRQRHGAERFSKMHLLDTVLFYLHLCEYRMQLHGDCASDAINCASVFVKMSTKWPIHSGKRTVSSTKPKLQRESFIKKKSLLALREKRVLIVSNFQAVSHLSSAPSSVGQYCICNSACFFFYYFYFQEI